MNLNRRYIICLLWILLWSPGVFAKDTLTWKLKRNKNDIQVFTRSVEGSKFKEFKVTSLINLPIEHMLDYVMDVELKSQWMEDLERAELIEVININEQIEYYFPKIPKPFKKRDIILHVVITQLEKDTVRIEYKSVPDLLPEKENIIRMNNSNGWWELVADSTDQTRLTYGMIIDPGGKIPAWIVNMFLVDGPYDSVSNLKKIVARKP